VEIFNRMTKESKKAGGDKIQERGLQPASTSASRNPAGQVGSFLHTHIEAA
jgi:hypothetical protein